MQNNTLSWFTKTPEYKTAIEFSPLKDIILLGCQILEAKGASHKQIKAFCCSFITDKDYKGISRSSSWELGLLVSAGIQSDEELALIVNIREGLLN